MNRSYVGMDCCIYYGEPKGILIDRRMSNTLDRCQVVSPEPCDKCKAVMSKGFTFIVRTGEEPDSGYTGQFITIKTEAAEDMIDKEFLAKCKDNTAFISKEMAIELGILENGM